MRRSEFCMNQLSLQCGIMWQTWPNFVIKWTWLKLQNQTDSWATLLGSITSHISGKMPEHSPPKGGCSGTGPEGGRNWAYHSSSLLIMLLVNAACKICIKFNVLVWSVKIQILCNIFWVGLLCEYCNRSSVSVSVGNSQIAVDQSAGVWSTDLLKTQATITIVILE